MRKAKYFVVFWLFLFLSSNLLAGEARKRPIEIFALFNLSFSAMDTVYAHRYTLDYSPGFEDSSVAQDLTVQGQAGAGWNAGLFYPLNRQVGLKFAVNYSRNPLGGENSPYEISLQYISIQPPDYQPHEVSDQVSLAWVPTRGHLKSLSLLLNLQYIFSAADSWTASLSAGGGLGTSWGQIHYLGYSDYWLGGHGVLFSELDLLKLKIPSSSGLVLDADIELGFKLSEKISLATRLACLFRPNFSATPVIDDVLAYYSLDKVSGEKLELVRSRLKLHSLKINPSLLNLNIGIKYSFVRL